MALPIGAVLPLVAAVAAVVVAVAHPHVGHALVVAALEVVLGAPLRRAAAKFNRTFLACVLTSVLA